MPAQAFDELSGTREEELTVSPERDTDLVAMDDALVRLAIDPRQSQVVELRFFGA